MNERDLVTRAQKGEKDAFEQLVIQNQKMVYNYCLRMVGNREDAFDLSQEAFLKAYKALSFFKRESSFSTWLYRLTGNTCIDFLRKRGKSRVVSLSMENDAGEETEMQLPDENNLPEDLAERRELREAVARGLRLLSNNHRQVLVLRELNGLSYREIADSLEISEGTVKSRISRARLELCKYLKEYGNFQSGPSSNEMKGG